MAHNNPGIDYGQMALVNALMIKRNMGVPVCLVTDAGTIGYLREVHNESLIAQAFDDVKVIEVPEHTNVRNYSDSTYMNKVLPYNNGTRIDAYALSPFDETLVIDTDFLIMNDSLNSVWGSEKDFMMNRQIETYGNKDYFAEQLGQSGIPQYWATVMFFRKSETAENIFNMCRHIKENYEFYKFIYGFAGRTFRNDYVYSIALHMMSGFVESDVYDLPDPTLLFTSDLDVLIKVPNLNQMQFLIDKPGERGTYFTVLCDSLNVHVMNKYSINRFAQEFIQLYSESTDASS